MAMSEGERLWRLQQSSNRFLSRQQTTTSWNHTREIVQPRSSGVVFPKERTPSKYNIQGSVVSQGSQVPGSRDNAIGKNVYSADGAPIGCCATVVTSGTETFDQTNALIQKAQSSAICCQPDYAKQNGYSIDLKPLGGVCCPLPNLPNDAKVTDAFKCSSCLQFYFPNPAQPKCCPDTPYPQSALYPPPPIDWELRRYGDIRVPQQAEKEFCGPAPNISNLEITAMSFGTGPWLVNWDQVGAQYVTVSVYDPNNQVYSASITYNSITEAVIDDFTDSGSGTNYEVVVKLYNECGSVSQRTTFYVRGNE